jgi:hypothetical protein
MTGLAYASGRYAWAECQKCGLRFKYLQIVSDGHWRHLRVCPQCYDVRHPQERLKRVSDAVALWRASPDSRHAPTTPVLAGVLNATTAELTWASVTSQDSRPAGYKLLRAIGAADPTQIANLEIERDYIGGVVSETLEYDDAGLASGSYTYRLRAYDLRGLESGDSNLVSLTVP